MVLGRLCRTFPCIPILGVEHDFFLCGRFGVFFLILLSAPELRADSKALVHDTRGIKLSKMAIQASGITINKMKRHEVARKMQCDGRIDFVAQQHVFLKAPNAGTLFGDIPSLGSQVERGQSLVKIRSKLSHASYSLKAPFAGEIIEVYPSPFQFVNESADILQLANLEQVSVFLRIPIRSIDLVALGQHVEGGGLDHREKFRSKIQDIGRTVDEPSQSTWVRLNIENKNRRWVPGQLIQAEVFLSDLQTIYVVDEGSVQQIAKQSVVFVFSPPGRFEVRPIKAGAMQSGLLEIVAGLAEGESYVESGSALLKTLFDQTVEFH